MAKNKMNQDFMKNLLLGIIIIVALHILQTLFYKFIGYDLWDILKVKKEKFKQQQPPPLRIAQHQQQQQHPPQQARIAPDYCNRCLRYISNWANKIENYREGTFNSVNDNWERSSNSVNDNWERQSNIVNNYRGGSSNSVYMSARELPMAGRNQMGEYDHGDVGDS